MAGEVIATGTRAADAAPADARKGTDPSAQDAEQAEAAVAADVPEPRVLNGTPERPPHRAPRRGPALPGAPGPPGRSGPGCRRRRASPPTRRYPGSASGGGWRGSVPSGARTSTRSSSRSSRPCARRIRRPMSRLIERAYDSAAYWHRDQKRRSGDPYITHPLAVATILAELGMNTETICAALLHDTVEDTPYTLTELRGEFGEDIARWWTASPSWTRSSTASRPRRRPSARWWSRCPATSGCW